VRTIDELARADIAGLAAAGVPSDGLDRMSAQAGALLEGRAMPRGRVALPQGLRRELYLHMETDPLDHGEPFLVAWAEAELCGALGAAEVAVVSGRDERAAALLRLIEVLESPGARGEPVFTFGAGTAAAFDAIAEEIGLDPARSGDLAGRIVDLAPWVRRAAVLPVFHYRFDEVAAVARGRPRPSPGEAEDASFVLHAALAASQDPEAIRDRLARAGHDALVSLRAIRAWFEP
jgi:hypothetical protein